MLFFVQVFFFTHFAIEAQYNILKGAFYLYT